ncbi:MAG: hypothetical protein EXR27_21555 [Betaproteobacteria bacterium]|nr:hypothetical protein [Betaproteobacteria bacterium]
MKNLRTVVSAWFAALCMAPVNAADISIALGADVTSIDPHYHNLTPNNNIAEHVFETLVTKDARSKLGSSAESVGEFWLG